MRDIGPGDVVECINVANDGGPTLTLGARYTVRTVLAGWGTCGCHGRHDKGGLTLVEQPVPAGYDSGRFVWCVLSFRPIGGSREEVLRQFEQSSDESGKLTPMQRVEAVAVGLGCRLGVSR